MNHSSPLRVLFAAVLVLGFASGAYAQATRTWVSGVGDDANPCSRTAPCKTFAGAISKTAPCGEIDVIDQGAYGAVTITKAITIDATGQFAGVLATLGSSGVIINAGVNDTITLRNLSIGGACSGADGIRILSCKNVNVEDSVIFKFTGDGIEATDSNGLNVNLRETVIRDNGEGINASSTSTIQEWTIEHCSLNGNSLNGINAKNNTRINVRESVIAGNTVDGVVAHATSGVGVVNLWNCQIFGNNSDGVQSGIVGEAGTGFIRIALNMIIQNTGIGANETTQGTIETFSNNMILGNGTNGCTGCAAVGPGN